MTNKTTIKMRKNLTLKRMRRSKNKEKPRLRTGRNLLDRQLTSMLSHKCKQHRRN